MNYSTSAGEEGVFLISSGYWCIKSLLGVMLLRRGTNVVDQGQIGKLNDVIREN